jgi:hypothetical protein
MVLKYHHRDFHEIQTWCFRRLREKTDEIVGEGEGRRNEHVTRAVRFKCTLPRQGSVIFLEHNDF